jgi:transposase
MSKKEIAPNRQYTEEFKVEAVRLAGSIGGNAAAKRLGVPQSTVTNWVRTRQDFAQPAPSSAGASTPRRPISDLEAENARLRRELANTKLDLEIVKKAAAYFAKESR